MRGLPVALALIGALATTPLPAQTPSAARPGTLKSATTAAAVGHQRAEVKRLEHDVAGKEASSRDAAARLQQKDAKIAELQRQLQAVEPVPAAAANGH